MLRKLEKYDILEELGHGGMATVYRARDERLDREVAIKVLHPHLQGAREARSRFEREARSVARLRHPNILEIYDYSGADSHESYIAAELLTGPTLKHFAESHPDIPAEMAACFAIEVAQALAAAHAHGIIHRDVKPENVLIHDDRCVKLTDFGIAQMVDAQSFTVTGQVLGSPGHMAPEQVEGKDCDARSDLFSLGTVLYYLALGRLPFRGNNPHQILKRIVDGQYADPLRVRPSIGARLAGIIVKSLAHDPEDRYQSAEGLIRDLEAFVGQVGIVDPAQALARYLTDPQGYGARLRATTIDALATRGERLAREGDFRGAIQLFDRVLALDEGNARVLEQVDKLHRRGDRRRQAIIAAGVVLGLLGLGAMTFALQSRSDVELPETTASARAGARGPALVDHEGHGPSGPSGSERTRATPAETRTSGRGGSGSSLEAVAAGAGRAHPPTPARSPSDTPSPTRRAVARRTPRMVVFQPTPQNVLIGVDGARPRPFGPSFHRAKLEPGPHRFLFKSGADCCLDAEVTRVIPPGPGTTVVAKQLPLRPAGLYVVSNVPADVKVADGRAVGRTREVLRVPMKGDVEDVVGITVTAVGHRVYTGAVRLRAGKVSEVNVQLKPAKGAAR